MLVPVPAPLTVNPPYRLPVVPIPTLPPANSPKTLLPEVNDGVVPVKERAALLACRVVTPPTVKVLSIVDVPAILAFPQTSSLLAEVVAPMPTFPSTNNPSVGAEIPCLVEPIWALPATERREFAVVIPIPT